MKDVFRKTGFTLDARVVVADGETIGNRAFFVSKARFLAEREALLARGSDLGVVLDPGDRLEVRRAQAADPCRAEPRRNAAMDGSAFGGYRRYDRLPSRAGCAD